jgi:hypothetical protein
VNSNLELQLKTLPSEPGVYRYYDKNDQLLYVGKAKHLKKECFLTSTKPERLPDTDYGFQDSQAGNYRGEQRV